MNLRYDVLAVDDDGRASRCTQRNVQDRAQWRVRLSNVKEVDSEVGKLLKAAYAYATKKRNAAA